MSDQQNYETQLYHRMCDKLWSVVTQRDGMDCASIAAAELTRLRAFPVTLDTPHEVCDGIITMPLGEAIDLHGDKCREWVVDAKEVNRLEQENTRLRAELTALRAVAEAAQYWIVADERGAVNDSLIARAKTRAALTALAAAKAASKPTEEET